MFKNFCSHAYCLVFLGIMGLSVLCTPAYVHAQTVPAPTDIPGSADPGRLDVDPDTLLPERPPPEIKLPDGSVIKPRAPEDAEDITFKLKSVRIDGATAFTQEQLADIYQPFIGHEIKLSRPWEFAGRITERYRAEGYFLSRAYISAQEITDGEITIEVIEGYIHNVHLQKAGQSTAHKNHLVEKLIGRITDARPISLKKLENSLLLLNDIPGLQFETVIAPDDALPDGAINLVLLQRETQGRGNLRVDNHGSRFTGPFRTAFAYEDSVLPLQKTSLSGIVSVPELNELTALTLQHEARILPRTSLLFSVAKTESRPGFTLSQFDIESQSFSWRVGFVQQILRQRQQSLDVGLALDYRDSDTDVLDTVSSRDRIRKVQAKLNYDGRDPFKGVNDFNVTVSQGIDGLGANDAGDANLSRPEAKPDFTAFNARWQRQQFIARDWLLTSTLVGQKASGPLLASEEFGFGGPTLGRAYDASEITGDDGIAGSLEVSFTGIKPVWDFNLTPSVFYDIGKVWNQDAGQPDNTAADAAGLGLRFAHPSGLGGRLSFALPLTTSPDTSGLGNNDNEPHLFFQIGQSF